jgi:hypothetical protein
LLAFGVRPAVRDFNLENLALQKHIRIEPLLRKRALAIGNTPRLEVAALWASVRPFRIGSHVEEGANPLRFAQQFKLD